MSDAYQFIEYLALCGRFEKSRIFRQWWYALTKLCWIGKRPGSIGCRITRYHEAIDSPRGIGNRNSDHSYLLACRSYKIPDRLACKSIRVNNGISKATITSGIIISKIISTMLTGVISRSKSCPGSRRDWGIGRPQISINAVLHHLLYIR